MVQVRVRAVANVMGLRRGDEGDVETGSLQVDQMIERGYLEILEYLPDLPPPAESGGWVIPPPTVEEVERELEPRTRAVAPAQPPAEVPPTPKEKGNASKGTSSSKARTSRSRSKATRDSAGDTGDGADARSSKRTGSSGHGQPEGPDADAGEVEQP